MIVTSLAELRRIEGSLVERINASRNGGARFLAHPLRMLRELDIELSSEALRELRRLEPKLTHGSDTAYEALLAEEGESQIRVVVTDGLFRPGEW